MGKRLFVSIDLPDGLDDDVAAVQDELRDASGLDLTDPGRVHVTLKFLGDTDPGRLDALSDALAAAVEEAGVGPFEATYGGLGVFPSLDYIRVVWLGVEAGGEEMTRLAAAVEDRTTALGFDPEDHDFTPHATIARMRNAGGKEHVQRVVRERSPTVGTGTVDEVRLTESVLDADGATYTTLERFPL